jgi:quercetin dioxygenase-like cupin family protein
VLNGKIEITVGEQLQKLGTGDSIYLAAGTLHKWRNTGKETAKLISVATPPRL